MGHLRYQGSLHCQRQFHARDCLVFPLVRPWRFCPGPQLRERQAWPLLSSGHLQTVRQVELIVQTLLLPDSGVR